MSIDQLRRKARKHGLVLRFSYLVSAAEGRSYWRVQESNDNAFLCRCTNEWRCVCPDEAHPNPDYRGTNPMTYREIEDYLEGLS